MRTVAALSAIAVVSLAMAAPARADLTATLESVTLPTVQYSHDEQTTSGTAVLTAGDGDAGDAGWHVTLQSSDLLYAGAFNGTNIPSEKLAVTDVADAAATTGQAVHATGGPQRPSAHALGTLDAPRKVLRALPGYGRGTYAAEIELALNIPRMSARGTYTATITTTIVAGP